ncbi:MAG: hypothetical protein LJE67_04510, partial [Salaquimonas sp.]|nr:hypothetical protein [Salaquimonas sp.]
DELARLNEANSDGGDEAPATRSTAPESASAPADSAPGQPASDRTPTPRDPLLVAGAMRQSRGLGDIPDNERDRIATGLIEGECVRDVLKEVFGTPPGDALNDLVGALDSDC